MRGQRPKMSENFIWFYMKLYYVIMEIYMLDMHDQLLYCFMRRLRKYLGLTSTILRLKF
jgi:hypothetical protein